MAGTPASSLFYMALRLAGVTKREQVGPSPDQLADCLQQGNLMIGGANCNELMILSRAILTFPLTGAKIYTIGPGGNFDTTPNPRPQLIDAANLVIVNNAGSSPIRLPIKIWEFDEWSRLRLQDIPNGLPTRMYCDYNSPLSKIYIWTQDQGAGNQLELYAWQSIPKIVATTDLLQWPDGYEDWFVNNLAVRLASIFRSEGASVTDDTRILASKSEAAIQAHNAPTPQMDVHPGIMPIGTRSSWNRYTGD
jgi:hypothetical protein